MQYYHPDSDYYRKLGVTPPEATAHGVTDSYERPLGDQLQWLKPNSWRLEGNKLIGMTEMGELVQTIPTDFILEGTDTSGLPKFRKIVLS